MLLNPRLERPNANWRRKYAELRPLLRARRRLGVVITPAVIIRGALRVMNWLQPPPPAESLAVFSTFREGARWVEAQGCPQRPLLEKFLEEACAEIGLRRETMPALAG